MGEHDFSFSWKMPLDIYKKSVPTGFYPMSQFCLYVDILGRGQRGQDWLMGIILGIHGLRWMGIYNAP